MRALSYLGTRAPRRVTGGGSFVEGSDAPGAAAGLDMLYGGDESGSWLTTKLPDNTAVASTSPGSVGWINDMFAAGGTWVNGVNDGNFTSIINVVPVDAPIQEVVPQGRVLESYATGLASVFEHGLPIPAETPPFPVGDTDAEMVLVQPDWQATINGNTYHGRMYELWVAVHPDISPSGLWEAYWGGRAAGVNDYGVWGSGHWFDWWWDDAAVDSFTLNDVASDHNWGAQATSIPLVNTIISRLDIIREVCKHPVHFMLPGVDLVDQMTPVWPAQRWDGSSTTLCRQGMRFRLPYDYVINPAWPWFTQFLAQAAKDYGLVFTDTAGAGVTFRGEPGFADLVPGGFDMGDVALFPFADLVQLEVGSDVNPNPTVTNPSGVVMPSSKVGMRQVVAEDFNTATAIGDWPASGAGASAYPVLGTFPSWTTDPGYTDSAGDGHQGPELVLSTSSSCLDWFLHTAAGFPQAAVVLPAPAVDYSYTYGRYETMMSAESLNKWKVAWLLWPLSETWPDDGEIDFPEGPLDGNFEAYMHKQDGTGPTDQDSFISTTPIASSGATTFHHCIIEWLPGFCRFTLDGVVLGTSVSRVPSTPMNFRLQSETDTTAVPPSSGVQGHVKCDWLVTYERQAGAWEPPLADADTWHYGATAAAGNSFALTMGSGDAEAGQLLIVPVVTKGTGVTVTPPGGGAWTQLGSAVTQGGMRAWIFYRYHPGGAQTFTFTTTGATHREAMVVILGDTAASSPIDTNAVAGATSATVTAPTVTASVYDLLVSVFMSDAQDSDFARPEGMARLYPFSLTTGIKVAVEPVAPGATGAKAKTFGASGDRVAWNILVKGA